MPPFYLLKKISRQESLIDTGFCTTRVLLPPSLALTHMGMHARRLNVLAGYTLQASKSGSTIAAELLGPRIE